MAGKTLLTGKSEKGHRVPKEKIELVKKIAKLIDENNTIMFASIKSLPSKQFQKIKKSISQEVIIMIPKKNLLNRALEISKKENIKELLDKVKEDIAVLITNIDAFELSAILAESKTPVKAKAGQIAETDIEIEPGPTELVAGPVVSELGSLGIKIEIKAGKIEIKEPKVIIKGGHAINDAAVSIMSKLNINPFSVGFTPVAAYDSTSKKVFSDLIIDKKTTLESVKNMFAKSLAFAVSISYPTKETIIFLLAKAASHERAIVNLINIPQSENLKISSEEKTE